MDIPNMVEYNLKERDQAVALRHRKPDRLCSYIPTIYIFNLCDDGRNDY